LKWETFVIKMKIKIKKILRDKILSRNIVYITMKNGCN